MTILKPPFGRVYYIVKAYGITNLAAQRLHPTENGLSIDFALIKKQD